MVLLRFFHRRKKKEDSKSKKPEKDLPSAGVEEYTAVAKTYEKNGKAREIQKEPAVDAEIHTFCFSVSETVYRLAGNALYSVAARPKDDLQHWAWGKGSTPEEIAKALLSDIKKILGYTGPSEEPKELYSQVLQYVRELLKMAKSHRYTLCSDLKVPKKAENG